MFTFGINTSRAHSRNDAHSGVFGVMTHIVFIIDMKDHDSPIIVVVSIQSRTDTQIHVI